MIDFSLATEDTPIDRDFRYCFSREHGDFLFFSVVRQKTPDFRFATRFGPSEGAGSTTRHKTPILRHFG